MATRQDSSPLKGDLLLERVLKLVVWCETEINPKYRKVLEQKILHARMKGLNLLREPGFLNREKYRWAARDALKYAKAVSHRAQTSLSACSANPRDQLTLSVQRLYRCHLSYKNAYPMDTSINQWVGELWDHVSLQTGITDLLTPEDLEKVCKLVTCGSLWHIICLKARIRPALQSSGYFVSGQGVNGISNSVATLSNISDIYECQCQGGQCPCQHCTVQAAINTLWFQQMDDDCKTYQQQYLSMPIPAVALAFTMVQCADNERTHGMFNETSWDAEAKYKHHHESIIHHERGLNANVTDALSKFLENARTYAAISRV